MHLKIAPETLRSVVADCAKVVGKEGAEACLLLEARGSELHLRAASPHAVLITAIAADVSETGSVLVDSAKLQALLAVRPDSVPLAIKKEGHHLLIRQGEFRLKLGLFRDGTLPPITLPRWDEVDVIKLPSTVLHGMRRVKQAVEAEEDALFIGMLLDFSDAATSLRVAAFTRAILQIAHFDFQFQRPVSVGRIVLPPKIVQVISSFPEEPFELFFEAEAKKVWVRTSKFQLRLSCPVDRFPVEYVSVLGLYRWKQGAYPVPLLDSSNKVVAEHPRAKLAFNRADLLAALASASIALSKEDVIVELKVDQRLADGRVVVELIGRAMGSKNQATEKVLATGEVVSANSFGLNAAAVKAVLQGLEGDICYIYLGRKEDPIVITDSHEHVVSLATLMRL